MSNSPRRFFYTHRTFLIGTTISLFTSAILLSVGALNLADLRLVALAILTALLLILFVLLQSWFYQQTEKVIFPQVARWMITKGRISSEDQILFPYVSDSRLAQPIISHLTTGKVWLLDIYTPQVMTANSTKRARAQDALPKKDPRLKYIPGNITLLPFQNEEIDVIILSNILNEISQFGDRERFLAEISRVLKPNGRILIFEPIKSRVRVIVNPTSFFQFWTATEIKQQLDISGFTRIELQTPAGLTILGQALALGRYENTQLPLDF